MGRLRSKWADDGSLDVHILGEADEWMEVEVEKVKVTNLVTAVTGSRVHECK